jgi:hypothetical protein
MNKKRVVEAVNQRTRVAPYHTDALLRMTQVEREREIAHAQNNNKAKSDQLKFSQTYLSI